MNGWLIYDEEGAQKNGWFIHRLTELLNGYGHSLQVKTDIDGALPDFAIVRAIRPDYNESLEKRGVRVFNNFQTARVACDKWQTYSACKKWDIPVLPTQFLGEPKSYPTVLKSVDGHGGAQVFWIENYAQFLEKRAQIQSEYILQEPSKTLGRDMRVYAVGGEIVASVLRRSDDDFRSNFSLGGKVESATPTKEMQQIVKKLYEKLHFDYVGVDFLQNGESWVLNEIEDSAGARMLYSCTDVDIARRYAEHINEQIKKAGMR